MKKLLTLLSAATVAIGLYADGAFATGTSFEDPSCVAGTIIDITQTTDDLGGNSGSNFWATNGSANVALRVVQGESREHTSNGDYPSQFYQDGELENTKYLHVETTFGNAVARYATTNGTARLIGDGLYFDSLVKFTVFEECPTNTPSIDFSGAKIAVWVQEEEVENVMQTNLYVRAGTATGDAINYSCGGIEDPEATSIPRLTRIMVRILCRCLLTVRATSTI